MENLFFSKGTGALSNFEEGCVTKFTQIYNIFPRHFTLEIRKKILDYWGFELRTLDYTAKTITTHPPRHLYIK